MKYEILAKRGNTSYLVKKEDIFYFIDVYAGTVMKDQMVDVFLKWGYFEDVNVVEDPIKQKIEELIEQEETQK